LDTKDIPEEDVTELKENMTIEPVLMDPDTDVESDTEDLQDTKHKLIPPDQSLQPTQPTDTIVLKSRQ